MQFSNLSLDDLNRLRAKFGMGAATQGDLNGLLSSGVVSSERVLAAPGTAAYERQLAEDPEWVRAQEAARDRAQGAVQNKAPETADTPPPPGVSQYIWDRVVSGNLSLNPTLITRDPAVRDALIEAGYTDYVKGAYEKAMDINAAHAISNGADPSAAWGSANNSHGNDWYSQNYGTYSNNTVAGSTGESGAGDFTFGGGSVPEGTDDNPYVPPSVGGGSGGGGGGGGNGGGGGIPDDVIGGETGGGEFEPISSGFGAGRATGSFQVGGGHDLTAGAASATPFADAYIRSMTSAREKGPVSKLFAKELGE